MEFKIIRLVLFGLVLAAVTQARAAIPTQLTLTWDAVTTNVDGTPATLPVTYTVYSVFEDAIGNGTSPVIVLSTGLTTLTYTDSRTVLLPGINACYRVSAVEATVESYPSSTICKTIVKRHAVRRHRRSRTGG